MVRLRSSGFVHWSETFSTLTFDIRSQESRTHVPPLKDNQQRLLEFVGQRNNLIGVYILRQSLFVLTASPPFHPNGRIYGGRQDSRRVSQPAPSEAKQIMHTANENTRPAGNWFRVGFEPLFVDFAKAGTWFVRDAFSRGGAQAWYHVPYLASCLRRHRGTLDLSLALEVEQFMATLLRSVSYGLPAHRGITSCNLLQSAAGTCFTSNLRMDDAPSS